AKLANHTIISRADPFTERLQPGTKKPARKAAGFFATLTEGVSADDFGVGEPVLDFLGSGFGCVRTVYRDFANGQGVGLADRAFVSIGRVGGTHDLAVLEDGILSFENLHDRGAGSHAFNELAEERTFLVDGVEAFGFPLAHPDALRRNDAQAGIFQHL